MRRFFGTYTKLKHASMISKRAKRYNYKKRGGDPEKRGGFKKRFAEFDRKMETSLAEIEREAEKSSLPFRTVASVLLERTPVINKAPESFEIAYEEMRQQRTEGTHHLYVPESFYEKKRSYDESMEQAKELVSLRAERRAKGENLGEDVQDETLRALIWELEFEAAKRTTENDESGNRRTTWRRLDSSLFLLVKKDREEHAWQFPQGGWEEEDGSSLRVTAEREFREECGDHMPRYFVSNAPNSFRAYAYPESVQKKHNAFGAKVFYYRALFQGAYFDEDASTPNLENGLVDYAWVAADELDDYFESDHAEYMRQVL